MIDTKISLSNPVIMRLEPEWFKMGYYVYVVLIRFKGRKYYYIGMTGDRKHITARSPFYRMGGHFMLGKSTQNQIIKGIESKLKFNVKEDSNILCEMNFTYYAWLIKDFMKNISKEDHGNNRTIAEKIESGLIEKCKVSFGEDYVFNNKGSRKNMNDYDDEVIQIFNQLNAQ